MPSPMPNGTDIVQSSDNDYTLGAPNAYDSTRESNNILHQMFSLYGNDCHRSIYF